MSKPNASDNQLDFFVDDLIHNTQEPNNYPSVLPHVFKGKIEVSEGQSSFAISRLKLTQSILKNMPITCYLCFIHSETKTSYVLMDHTWPKLNELGVSH